MSKGKKTKGYFMENDNQNQSKQRRSNSNSQWKEQLGEARTKMVEPITIRIDENFKEQIQDGWKIWINRQNRIICAPVDSKDETRHYRTFTNEPGTLYLKNEPNKKPYVYFRTDAYENFLSEIGYPFITTADPCGEYQGFSGVDKEGNVYHTLLTCNGDIVRNDKPSGEKPIVAAKYANSFFSLTNASIIVFDKVKLAAGSDEIERHRSVITKYSISEEEVKNVIRDMAQYNTTRTEEWRQEVIEVRNKVKAEALESQNRKPVPEKMSDEPLVIKYADSVKDQSEVIDVASATPVAE